MDQYQCTKNISYCTKLYNLTRCSPQNNICVEDHGYCIFNETMKPKCLCLPCFGGANCQEELSRNLWFFSIPYDEVAPNGRFILPIMMVIFGAFLLFNGILCLQTYLCKRIRKTNLGIYLIMLTVVSIFIGLRHFIFYSVSLHRTKLAHPHLFYKFHCLFSKFVYIPLVAMYNWFIAGAAIERVLVECFKNYGLHDSRRRSLVFSAAIVIICPLTVLPGIFTVRKNQPAEWRFLECLNFTPLGYTIYSTITRIHLFAFYFVYIVMNAVVLSHLLRHRRRFVDSDSLLTQVCLILQKHKDFFIPYLIQALGQLPSVIMDFLMTCSTANTRLVARLDITFTALQIAPFVVTFYLYIYLSPVYWSEFCNSSPIGKCLTKVKKKLQIGNSSHIIKNNNPPEVYL